MNTELVNRIAELEEKVESLTSDRNAAIHMINDLRRRVVDLEEEMDRI